jgi:hypothetical protein
MCHKVQSATVTLQADFSCTGLVWIFRQGPARVHRILPPALLTESHEETFFSLSRFFCPQGTLGTSLGRAA